jgi:hypothetical protein
MDSTESPFVRRRLENMYAIEREIIRLYADICYANIQAAHGNRSSMDRLEQLNDALQHAVCRLQSLKADLRRIGVPEDVMISLDDLQRLSLFESEFGRHAAAFAAQPALFGREHLCAMLEDITESVAGDA